MRATPKIVRPIRLLAAGCCIVLLVACSGDPPSLDSAPANPAPFTVETPAGTKIHVIQTGWGSVKQNAFDATGPGFLRILGMMTGSDFSEWFPVNFYAIERSGKVLVHDTGETARILEEGYYRCDAFTEWVVLTNFRFSVAPEFELGPQLERLGIDPATVDFAVLSHLHPDHVGGMRYLTGAEFLISRTDSEGHLGAIMCRIPEWVEPTLVDYAPEPFGAFRESYTIAGDPNLRIVPTPGHTPGHQSLMLREQARYYLFAGDAIVDLQSAEETRDSGIAADPDAAEHTHETIRAQLRDFTTILAPAHDPGTQDAARYPGHVH